MGRLSLELPAFGNRRRKGDIREFGREQGAEVLLEGSVRRSSGNLEITTELIEARNGYHRWSETLHCAAGGLREIQDQAAHSLLRCIRASLTQMVPTVRPSPSGRRLGERGHQVARG